LHPNPARQQNGRAVTLSKSESSPTALHRQVVVEMSAEGAFSSDEFYQMTRLISGMDCSAEADFGVFKKTAQFLRRFRQAMGST
jgi:hypothetical protein